MAAKRCPLCGGSLKDNYCDSCGYSLPDEEDISALYNYDPSDYPQEQPAVREITPKHITEEIYPNRPEPVEFKVREEPKKDTPFANPYANQTNGSDSSSGANPYAKNTSNQGGNPLPYAGPYINNKPPQNQNPYANANGNFKPYTNTNSGSGDFNENIKKYWWMLLIAFFIPFVGIAMLIVKRDMDKKFKDMILAAVILGFILPP